MFRSPRHRPFPLLLALLLAAADSVPVSAQSPPQAREGDSRAVSRVERLGTRTLFVDRGTAYPVGRPGDDFTSWARADGMAKGMAKGMVLLAGVRRGGAGDGVVVTTLPGKATAEGGDEPGRSARRAARRDLAEATVPARGTRRSLPMILPATAPDRGSSVAWFEGDHQLDREVWFADLRADGSFTAPRRIAGRVTGSQVGLQGGSLDDGRQVVLWSAWDGGDHEIVWSVRNGDTWSTPAPLHPANDTADISPALLVRGAEALLAWTRFDGELWRVVVSHFDGASWSVPRPASPSPAAQPRWVRDAGAPLLELLESQPSRWTVARLSAGGEPLDAVSLERGAGTPKVLAVGRDGVTVALPVPDALPLPDAVADGSAGPLAARSSDQTAVRTVTLGWERR